MQNRFSSTSIYDSAEVYPAPLGVPLGAYEPGETGATSQTERQEGEADTETALTGAMRLIFIS